MKSFPGSHRACRQLPVTSMCQCDGENVDVFQVRFASIKKQTRNALKKGLIETHAALGEDWPAALALRSRSEDYLNVRTKYYISSQGEVLATYSEIGGSGLDMAVILNGDVGGPGPVQMGLRGMLDMDNAAVEMLLKILRPFTTQEYSWEFVFDDVTALRTGSKAPCGVRLDRSMTLKVAAEVAGKRLLDFGGESILETLRLCMSRFAEGPTNYVECIAGRAGEDAARIALYMAKCV